jgi:Phage tail assembly chaperone protein
MIVAIVNNGAIEQTGDLYVLFPNVSFPASGPSSEWMAENNLVPVTYFKSYDAATQKLVSCEAYLEGGSVYAVTVESLSEDELTAKKEAARAGNRNVRNQMLRDTDWTQLPDVGLTSDCKAVFAEKRQELRDVDLDNPVWPEMPTEEWVA